MRKKLGILLALCILFILFIASRYILLSTGAGYGELKGLSTPDASVFVNNVAVGKTPYQEKMKEGDYILKFIPEGTATNTASWQGKVHIYKNTLTYVDRQLGTGDLTSSGVVFTTIKMTTVVGETGEIQVDSEPAGSIVYLDNDEKGIAPLLLSEVPKGEHELSVYSPSFFRRTQKINVDTGYRVIATFKLALDPSQKKLDLTSVATPSATLTPQQTPSGAKKVTILDTPTGFLRVRVGPDVNASEEAQIKPGDTYPLVDDTQPNWYKITYSPGKDGWIASQYAKK